MYGENISSKYTEPIGSTGGIEKWSIPSKYTEKFGSWMSDIDWQTFLLPFYVFCELLKYNLSTFKTLLYTPSDYI